MKEIKDKPLDFSGHTISMGIDNHLKTYKVSYYVDDLYYKTVSHPSDVNSLCAYLHNNFPNGSYKSAYEAGFSGFGLHKALVKLGIDNIVVHASDVPMSNKNREQKTDKRDAKQIGRCLVGGLLDPIYVPSERQIADRALLRYRDRIVSDLTRQRNRIKMFLYFIGIEIPELYQGNNWSRAFVSWLEALPLSELSSKQTLDLMLDQFKYNRGILLQANRELRAMSKGSEYSTNYQLLLSIPGIGPVGALRILTEIGDISRFPTEQALCSYAGLIPNSNSSGPKEIKSRITYRANKKLRWQLIEAAWVAIRHDPSLALYYSKKMKQTQNKNKAIVRVARKLLCRIRAVLIKQEKYVLNKS